MMRSISIWVADGNLTYAGFPHCLLLSAAILCLLLLWFPYAVFLFSMQWLRRIYHHGPLKLIARLKPFYDACFGSLKDKHHYWFGVLLLVQGLLHLMSSFTLNSIPELNKFLVLFAVIWLKTSNVYADRRRYDVNRLLVILKNCLIT